jgi:hypothetical protein
MLPSGCFFSLIRYHLWRYGSSVSARQLWFSDCEVETGLLEEENGLQKQASKIQAMLHHFTQLTHLGDMEIMSTRCHAATREYDSTETCY